MIFLRPSPFKSPDIQLISFSGHKSKCSISQRKTNLFFSNFFTYSQSIKEVKKPHFTLSYFTFCHSLKINFKKAQQTQTNQSLTSFKKQSKNIFSTTKKTALDLMSSKITHQIKNHHLSSLFLIQKSTFCVAYNAQHRTPEWVLEYLTADNLKGKADRAHSAFKEDKKIPKHLRSRVLDYKKSGFNLGHMASAANHRIDQKAMDDTFQMTNICPQNPKFNGGYWAKLEKYARDLTKIYHHVTVVTGPLFLPVFEKDTGKYYVKYEVIGNHVAVPTHFFKVMIMEDGRGNQKKEAYLLPHQPIPLETPLEHFKTTIRKIERIGGFILPK